MMSLRECHHTEETLPTVPLGQFQAQRSDNTTTNSIAHSDIQTSYNNSSDCKTYTSSQSESKHEKASDNSSTFRTTTFSQSEIFSSYNNSSDCKTYTSSQSEISEYDANSESSSRETSRPSSPESGNLTTRTLYSPLPEMAIVHRTMHDAIHAVREQQGRAVTRSLLSQQRTLAANKLQCNIQIKRTSTPDPPSMSKAPTR